MTVPWITLSSFLLTEVAAYPAFVWALLAIQASVARPSVRNDLLAVAAIALAVLARTQFYALAMVLAAVVIADALVGRRLKAALREHVTLVAVYAFGAVCALALVVSGHALLGTYAQTAKGNPLPPQIIESAPAHVAVVALAGGLLPFLLGGAWAVANLVRAETREARAFAWLTVVAVVVLAVEVASFNLRFGGGLVRERYLFYLTPLFLCAFAAALTAARLPRWSLLAPLSILIVGFWRAPLPAFEKLNVDTPASVIYDWLLSTMHGTGGARLALILCAVVVALLVLEGGALLPREPFAVALCSLLLVALVAETGYAFKRLFAVNGTSGLPLTLDQSPVFAWVDGQINGDSVASMVPYPLIQGTTGRTRFLVGPRVLEPFGAARDRATQRVLRHSRRHVPEELHSVRSPNRRGQRLVSRLRRPSSHGVEIPADRRDTCVETQLRPDSGEPTVACGLALVRPLRRRVDETRPARLGEDLRDARSEATARTLDHLRTDCSVRRQGPPDHLPLESGKLARAGLGLGIQSGRVRMRSAAPGSRRSRLRPPARQRFPATR